MAIGIILGIVIIGLFVGCLTWVGISSEKDNMPQFIIAVLLAFALLVSFIIVPFSIRTINTGEVAVVKHLGKVKEVKNDGTHFDIWFINKYIKYDSKVRKLPITDMAYSSDAQQMTYAGDLQYQILPDKAIEIARKYGTQKVLESRLCSVATERVKSILSEYAAMEIIANRSALTPEILTSVKEALETEYFITVTNVVLTNIDFSDAFESAVENKMISEQNKLKAQYESETMVIQAQAEADAKKLKAQAEAEANAVLEASLTNNILKQRYIEKWDGKLPHVVSDSQSLISIPDLE